MILCMRPMFGVKGYGRVPGSKRYLSMLNPMDDNEERENEYGQASV